MTPPVKTSSHMLACLIFFNLLSFTMRADDYSFELSGITTENTTPLPNVRVTIYEGTIFMTQYSTKDNGKFMCSLEFNKNFKITLEKDGYASEDISVNTTLPDEFPKQRITHNISLKMFALSKETYPFTFEEPVAKIFFHQVLKGFTNEINYKKTFDAKLVKETSVHDELGNTGISEEFKFELSLRRRETKKKEEDKATIEEKKEPVIVKTKAEELKKETPVKDHIVTIKAESNSSTQTKAIEPKVIENKNTTKKLYVEEERIPEKILIKKEQIIKKPEKIIVVEPEKNEIKYNVPETFNEGTRTITRINILKNEKTIEYTEVTYKKGGIHYFKNGTSISAETFHRETKKIK